MWTRQLLKTNAKQSLKNNFLTAFLVCLVFSIINGEFLSFNYNTSTGNAELQIFNHSLTNSSFSGYNNILSVILGLSILFTLIFGIFALIFQIAIVPLLNVGKHRFMMERRLGNSPFSTIFSAFSSGYLNIIFTTFLMNLKIFLWTLLLIIPGIIKSFEYSLVPYILAENPQISPNRAMELSKQMMDGEKLNFFVLSISFFGWYLLGLITFGISNLFVNVYRDATFAEFYAAMRAKAFGFGLTNEQELPDFVQHG